MATSSILTDFVIKEPKAVDDFIRAYEAASKEPEWKPTLEPARLITDPEEIRSIFVKGSA